MLYFSPIYDTICFKYNTLSFSHSTLPFPYGTVRFTCDTFLHEMICILDDTKYQCKLFILCFQVQIQQCVSVEVPLCSMLLLSKNKYLTKKAATNRCILIEQNRYLGQFFSEPQLKLVFRLVYSCVVTRKTENKTKLITTYIKSICMYL